MDRFIEFMGMQPILFTMLGIIVALITWTEYRRFTRGYQEIIPSDAVRLINHENAVLLDVREDAELAQGIIKDAKHIPLSVLKQRVTELNSSKEKPVIAFCRSGNRSTQASDILLKNEFQNVYHLKGGVMAWQNADLPLSKR